MYALIKSYWISKSYDSTTSVYVYFGVIKREDLLEDMARAGLWRRCGHEHDCCGCWFASYVADFHINSDNNTVVAVRFLKNV